MLNKTNSAEYSRRMEFSKKEPALYAQLSNLAKTVAQTIGNGYYEATDGCYGVKVGNIGEKRCAITWHLIKHAHMGIGLNDLDTIYSGILNSLILTCNTDNALSQRTEVFSDFVVTYEIKEV
jgi:hypothetical protein